MHLLSLKYVKTSCEKCAQETDTKNEEAKETKNDPVETTDTPNTANIEPSEDTDEVRVFLE